MAQMIFYTKKPSIKGVIGCGSIKIYCWILHNLVFNENEICDISQKTIMKQSIKPIM